MEQVIRKCLCNQDAVMKTVVKEGSNKGRKFWKCGQVEACLFWEWDDEPPRSTKSGRTGSMSGGQSSSSEVCFKVCVLSTIQGVN